MVDCFLLILLSIIITLAISKGIETGSLTFLYINNFDLTFFIHKQQDSSGLTSTLFKNVFKILSVPCQVSPELTNMPGMAKVLGLSLTRTCFFFKQEILFKKKWYANYLSLICCPLACHILK